MHLPAVRARTPGLGPACVGIPTAVWPYGPARCDCRISDIICLPAWPAGARRPPKPTPLARWLYCPLHLAPPPHSTGYGGFRTVGAG
jgi:hypothetical protein